MLKGVMISLKPQAHMISPVKSIDVRESLDLIPALSCMSHHNKEMLQEEIKILAVVTSGSA